MQAAIYRLGGFPHGNVKTGRDLSRSLGIVAAVMLHAGLASALLQSQPGHRSVPTPPIMVGFIASSPLQAETRPTTATKPQVVKSEQRPLQPQSVKHKPRLARTPPRRDPVIASRSAEPAPAIVAEAKSSPTPDRTESAAAQPAPSSVQTAPVQAPAAVTPPSFSAEYLQNPAPDYPAASRADGEQGRVLLRVLVGPLGSAERVEIRKTSGFGRLDDAARVTVRKWKFVPAQQAGRTVSAWVLVPISFSLEG